MTAKTNDSSVLEGVAILLDAAIALPDIYQASAQGPVLTIILSRLPKLGEVNIIVYNAKTEHMIYSRHEQIVIPPLLHYKLDTMIHEFAEVISYVRTK